MNSTNAEATRTQAVPPVSTGPDAAHAGSGTSQANNRTSVAGPSPAARRSAKRMTEDPPILAPLSRLRHARQSLPIFAGDTTGKIVSLKSPSIRDKLAAIVAIAEAPFHGRFISFGDAPGRRNEQPKRLPSHASATRGHRL